MMNFDGEEDRLSERDAPNVSSLVLTEEERLAWKELPKEFEDIFSDQKPGLTSESEY